MKKLTYKIFTIMNLVIGLTGMSAYAESPGSMRADIPFAFRIGEMTLPAGKYLIKLPPASGLQSRLVIRSADGRTTCIALTLPGGARGNLTQPELSFTRIGGQYYLSQIFTPALGIGQKLPLPEAADRLAQNR